MCRFFVKSNPSAQGNPTYGNFRPQKVGVPSRGGVEKILWGGGGRSRNFGNMGGSKTMPKYLVLNGRNKKTKCIVLKGPRNLFGAFEAEKHPISQCFHFLLNSYAQFGSKAQFLCEKAPNFSEKPPLAPKYWALRAKSFSPQAKVEFWGASKFFSSKNDFF